MKFLPTFGMFAAELLCCYAMARFSREDVPEAAWVYVLELAIFAVVAALGVFGDAIESWTYYILYFGWLVVCVVTAIYVAAHFNWAHGRLMGTLIIASTTFFSLTVALAASSWISKAMHRPLPGRFVPVLIQAMAMLAMALISFVSLMAPRSPASFTLIAGLAMHWLGQSVFAWVFAFGVLAPRRHGLWRAINTYAPSGWNLVVFALMALLLFAQQRELSKQHSQSAAHVELEVSQ